MRRFRPRSGGIELKLRGEEVDALALMMPVLSTVGTGDGDPAAERLSVAAYPEDREAQAEYGRHMDPELDKHRRLDRAVVASSLEAARRGSVRLDPAEADSWLMVINETRLVLAARLGIEEEGWGTGIGDRRRPQPEMALLVYLTEVQDDLIEALADQVQEGGPNDGRRWQEL